MAGITVLALGLIALLINWQPGKPAAKKGPAKAAAVGKSTLHFNWPERDRASAMLSIDGKSVSLDKPGDLKVPLSPGWHRIYIQRSGFEAIDQDLMLAQGQTRRFTPDWKAVSAAVLDPAGAGSDVAAPAENGASPIGLAGRPVAIPEFEGWLPSVAAAQERATSDPSKDTLLIVFGAAYHQTATQQLGGVLKDLNVTETYHCVIVNFERTQEGFGLSDDSPANQKLVEDYGIDRLPVLVLADAQARPFFIKRQWDDGLGTPKAELREWLKQRAERDRQLAAAEMGEGAARLAAAAKATEWLQEKELWRFYGEEFGRWLQVAQQADPQNAAGELEKFFEPKWLVHLVDADKSDARAIGAVTAQLDPWIERKFKDADRAVRLHMLAAQMLLHVDRQDDAARHMAQAVTYEPKDERLATAMKGLKYALENKDTLGSGTGFFVSTAGYILTNHHVIGGEGNVEVRLPGAKETVPAEVVAQNATLDIALLKVDLPEPNKVVSLPVMSGQVPRGEEVAAFGFPLTDVVGSTLKFTRGFVSADPDESSEGKYVLQLLINPGNSGGPLCDTAGRVVGMITAKTRTSAFEDSYALALPSATLVEFLDEHLPKAAPRAQVAEGQKPQTWAQVDQQVSGGVVMIVKKR
jgi:S1-C subfamily serine protease